jgi:Arc/MetJ-type ribon-helix-helix transcriptional regulator
MVRTQIQLTEEQARHLRRLSARTGRSMADLIREGVDELLRREGSEQSPRDRRARAAALAGRFHSGVGDLAEEHDRYLSEVYDS